MPENAPGPVASARVPGFRHVEHVMGTVFSFDIRHDEDPRLRAAVAEAVALLHRTDALFSTYRPDSAISRLGRGTTTLDRVPAAVAEVLDLCAEAERRTRGCFTCHPGGRLDPSGLVKGWAIEAVSDLLYAAGAHNTCVNGGGDVQVRGEAAPGRPWRVGIADPRDRRRLLTAVDGRDIAVATSGTAERGGHIIDPRSGTAVPGLVSATIVGPRVMWADVYATAAVVLGPDAEAWLAEIADYELAPAPSPG